MNCPHCQKEIVIVCGTNVSRRWVVTYGHEANVPVYRDTYTAESKEAAIELAKKDYPELVLCEAWEEWVVK